MDTLFDDCEDSIEFDSCAYCGGYVGVLGQLGSMLHLYCRDCGAHYHQRVEV